MLVAVHFLVFRSVDELRALDAHDWLLLGVLAIACMFVPGLLQAEGVRRVGAQRAAIGSTVGPPLDGIASRKDEAYITESLVNPNAKLAEGYEKLGVSPMPPMNLILKPQEFADVVTFLASARASYVTGSMIRIDGGLIASI